MKMHEFRLKLHGCYICSENGWSGDKPLSEQVTTNSTDAYMRQSASMSSGACKLSSGRYQIVDILERIA